MSPLSKENHQAIRVSVEEAGLTHSTLIDDVYDHLCCAVEFRMIKGMPFGPALDESIAELAPDGLATLQRETVFLLNAGKIRLIKKVLYGTGLVSTMLIVMSFLLKFLHQPLAGPMFMIGGLTAALLTLPLIIFERFKFRMKKSVSSRIAVGCGICALSVFMIAYLFKVNHMPGANLITVVSFMIFVTGFLPLLFLNVYRKSVEETVIAEHKFNSEIEEI